MLTAAVPEPAFAFAVCEPYAVVVPYWTYQVVACPPGTTLPVTVAVVAPIAVAGPVVAVGAAARAIPPKSTNVTADTATAASIVRLPVMTPPKSWPREHDPRSCGFLRTSRKGRVKQLGSLSMSVDLDSRVAALRRSAVFGGPRRAVPHSPGRVDVRSHVPGGTRADRAARGRIRDVRDRRGHGDRAAARRRPDRARPGRRSSASSRSSPRTEREPRAYRR